MKSAPGFTGKAIRQDVKKLGYLKNAGGSGILWYSTRKNGPDNNANWAKYLKGLADNRQHLMCGFIWRHGKLGSRCGGMPASAEARSHFLHVKVAH